jgi:hypothetical protein
MFDLVDEERSHPGMLSDTGLWRELGEISDVEARNKARVTQILREAEDSGAWKRAGFSSLTAWFAEAFRCDYRAAQVVTQTALALRALPAIDEAFGLGDLTLDQTVAATRFATPESDAEIARVAVGRQPSEIERVARTIEPPTVADDQALRKRRALSMTWVGGGRELVFRGSLPLEQGAAFEAAIRSVAKLQRAADKKAGGELLAWQQYAADALVAVATRTSGGSAAGDGDGGVSVRRSTVTQVVHLSADQAPLLEGVGAISLETAEYLTCDARRLIIKLQDGDLVHSRTTRCATYAQLRAMVMRSHHCQYPGCTAKHDLHGHHLTRYPESGKTETDGMILLCPRHHALVHDNHMRTTGTDENPIFKDEGGRAITANQPHAPPR